MSYIILFVFAYLIIQKVDVKVLQYIYTKIFYINIV